MLVQHHGVVHMKERLLTAKDPPFPGKPWRKFDPQDRYPKFGYIGYGDEPDYQAARHG